MSRLIVRNLPSGIKEDRLRNLFGQCGQVTDCNLKFTQTGQFRKFAFVGFVTAQEAQSALKQNNKTFIDASKIQVELAKDFGDANKPRAWSKYSKDSSANQKSQQKSTSNQKAENVSADTKKKKKKKEQSGIVDEMLGELKDDPKFREFLDAHGNIGNKPVWTNDSSKLAREDSGSPGKEDEPSGKGVKQSKKDRKLAKMEEDQSIKGDNVAKGDKLSKKERKLAKKREKLAMMGTKSEEESDNEMDDDGVEQRVQIKEKSERSAKKPGISDIDYLKSKVVEGGVLSDSDSGVEDSGDSDDETESHSRKPGGKQEETGDVGMLKTDEVKTEPSTLYMLKMKGIPANAYEKAIKEFFHPLTVAKIRVMTNPKKKPIGIAFVGFESERDLEQAMGRNKNFIGGKRIYLKKSQIEVPEKVVELKPRPWELKQTDPAEGEGIAETGRLFVRNLSYSCKEEDLENLFKKYGLLTEVNLPIDPHTKKLKGFAFVTYMMPEHAVKAFTDLDGTVFQGRMLHILPGKEKLEPTEDSTEGSSYKKEKQAKQKAKAASSHNWNTLFLGANAVADALAEKYSATKSKILDDDIKGSLGVRMALGETQIVKETRDFLTENGVSLDSFSQANAPRSKTVILVKNLPASTKVGDLEAVFGKHGTLGRVLMPPSGVTAIVEYHEPTEARAGFTRLAYTKFGHVPLYLEWAPMEVFISPPPVQPETTVTEAADKAMDMEDNSRKTELEKPGEQSSSGEEDAEPGSTLFVKNVNFDTMDDSLKQVFDDCSRVKSANIARKKDVKNPGGLLSMGYGFVEFYAPDGAQRAIKTLQHTELDGHKLELKVSNRTTSEPKEKSRKKQKSVKQKTTKILVRNIPFEAKRKEVEELFKVFGELKIVRLPKKMSGTGSHRGFGFVDFLTRQDAKRAFEALCHSTHLYGRRLVLEWAEQADDIEDIRKRTTEHFHDDGLKNKKLKKSGLTEHLEMSQDV